MLLSPGLVYISMINLFSTQLICQRHIALGFLLIVIVIEAVSSAARADDRRAEFIQLSVMPYLPPQQLETVFAPIANEFSKVLNGTVALRSSATFEAFHAAAMTGVFSLVYTHPFDFVELRDTLGYNAIAGGGDKLTGVIVTEPGSKLTLIEQLRGTTLALPPERSAVSRLILAHLSANGIDPLVDIKIQYFRSPHSCMHAVIIQGADACGTAHAPLRLFEAKMKRTLLEIAQTQSIPPSLFAAHPSISQAQVRALGRAITGWENSPEGKKLLESLGLERFVPVSNEDYDAVRGLISGRTNHSTNEPAK